MCYPEYGIAKLTSFFSVIVSFLTVKSSMFNHFMFLFVIPFIFIHFILACYITSLRVLVHVMSTVCLTDVLAFMVLYVLSNINLPGTADEK